VCLGLRHCLRVWAALQALKAQFDHGIQKNMLKFKMIQFTFICVALPLLKMHILSNQLYRKYMST